MLETAIQAAEAGGAVAERFFESPELQAEYKDDKSLVTAADKEIEALCAALIKERHPDHGIVGEEGENHNPDAEYQWYIDPIDGTSNFAHGIPFFSISVAVTKDHLPIAGVVYNPVTRGLYAAEAGKGASWNGHSMRVSEATAETAIVTVGYSQKEKNAAYAMPLHARGKVGSARILGSTALELAIVAKGATDGFICLGLNKWDYAAGWLLVQEAGGKISGCEGNTCTLAENYFVATNGHIHDAVTALASAALKNA